MLGARVGDLAIRKVDQFGVYYRFVTGKLAGEDRDIASGNFKKFQKIKPEII